MTIIDDHNEVDLAFILLLILNCHEEKSRITLEVSTYYVSMVTAVGCVPKGVVR